MNNTFKLSLISALLLSSSVYAENFRQHEVHVHGHVEFNIAQDKQELLIEINAPAMDVVGFEVVPETLKEKTLFEEAMQNLKDPQALVAFSKKANCQLTLSTISHSSADEELNKHEEDNHEHHSFNAEYHFECSDIKALTNIDVKWFNLFPNTNTINANILTDNVQRSVELTKDKTEIKL